MQDLITAKGSAGIAELMDKFKHSLRKDEMAEVLETLIQTGKIQAGPNKQYIRGKE